MHALVYNQFFTKHNLSVLTILTTICTGLVLQRYYFLPKIKNKTLLIVPHCGVIRVCTTIIILF